MKKYYCAIILLFSALSLNAQVNKIFSTNNYTAIDYNLLYPDGSSEARAASSAQAIKQAYPNSTDGVYFINVPTVGVKQVYCLMDNKYNGGGWMLAMKATRGTTFNFDANYWYTANTLNPNNVNRNDGDAKYDVFNYFAAKDLMALWPDIANIGTESGSIDNLTNWSWQENNFNGGNRTALINFFTQTPTATTIQTKTGGSNANVGITFTGFNSTIFTTEWGYMFYGFNYTGPGGASAQKVRWGLSYNNEADQNSNDASNGIGLSYNTFSAGDTYSFCCSGVFAGMNRSARVEMYIR
jgi:hypothetical protein